MTPDKQEMATLAPNILNGKKSIEDWMVEECGNSFLESYDSFSVCKAISDHDLDDSH